jgi:uncharacterized coiled-coil DUF342 family protein
MSEENTMLSRISVLETTIKKLSESVIKVLDKNKDGKISTDEWKQAIQSLKNSWYTILILGLNVALAIFQLFSKTDATNIDAIWMISQLFLGFTFTILKGLADREMSKKQISWSIEVSTIKDDYYKLSTQFVEAQAQITIRDEKIKLLQDTIVDLNKKLNLV